MAKRIRLGNNLFALVDDMNYKWLSKFSWHYQKNGRNPGYAATSVMRNKKGYSISMHRIIAGCPNGLQVDHKNSNTLDNRFKNLRICTAGENVRHSISRSKSGFKGVHIVSRTPKRVKKWRAQIRINGKNKHLGVFTSKRRAAEEYNRAAKKSFGEFALVNKF